MGKYAMSESWIHSFSNISSLSLVCDPEHELHKDVADWFKNEVEGEMTIKCNDQGLFELIYKAEKKILPTLCTKPDGDPNPCSPEEVRSHEGIHHRFRRGMTIGEMCDHLEGYEPFINIQIRNSGLGGVFGEVPEYTQVHCEDGKWFFFHSDLVERELDPESMCRKDKNRLQLDE